MSRFDRNALWLHFYLVFIDFIGFSKDLTMLNCKVLKEKSPYAVSGVYWIDLDGGSRSNAFQVYCDQQTDGGGLDTSLKLHFHCLLKLLDRPKRCHSAPILVS